MGNRCQFTHKPLTDECIDNAPFISLFPNGIDRTTHGDITFLGFSRHLRYVLIMCLRVRLSCLMITLKLLNKRSWVDVMPLLCLLLGSPYIILSSRRVLWNTQQRSTKYNLTKKPQVSRLERNYVSSDSNSNYQA